MAEERKGAAAHHAVDVPRQAGGGDEVQHGVEEGQVFGVVENGKRNTLNFCVCSHDFDFKGC